MKKSEKDMRKLIEELIKKMDCPTKKELWEAMNKKIALEEVSKIVDDLEKFNKIYVSIKGITWIHNTSPRLRKEISEGLEL